MKKSLLPGAAMAAFLILSVPVSAFGAAPPDAGIQSAIDAAAARGGGTVELPEGVILLDRYLFLRDGVTLKGAGEGRTILSVATPPRQRRLLALDRSNATATVEGDLSGIRTGMTVCIFSGGAGTWHGHLGYPTVGAIEGNRLVFSEPDKNTFIRATNTEPYLLFGHVTRLTAEAVKGSRSLRVRDPALAAPGRALTLNGQGDLWDYHCNVVAAVTGDTFHLERPLGVTAPSGTIVKLAFAMITSEFQSRIGVEDLTIIGVKSPAFRGDWGGFQLAGIHTRDCTNVTIRNVAVEDWNGDGFSLQGGVSARVERCSAYRDSGHGFHPGTGLRAGLFTNVVSGGNGGDGLYYCWHNEGVDVVDSVLTNNGGHGVGGLGIPGDIRCTVSGNRIEGNSKAGILVLGGPDSGNRIVRNTIRNNSREKPGAWAGVALHAIYSEGSSGCRIASNVIESTTEPATQWVGIEERHAKADERFKAKADPTTGLFLADRNTIEGNTLRGHKTADIIKAGSRTVIGPGQGTVNSGPPHE